MVDDSAPDPPMVSPDDMPNDSADAGPPETSGSPPRSASDRPAGRVRVLIIAGEPVANALLGMLLDPAVYDPVFPLLGEGAHAALDRLQPPLVLLLDGTLPSADSDELFEVAARRAAVVVLFAPPSRQDIVGVVAHRRSVAAFELPIDQASLSHVLDAAVARAAHAGLWALACVAGTLTYALLGAGVPG